MQNFIAQSMRKFGLAPKNKVLPSSPTGSAAGKIPDSNKPLSHMEVQGKYAYSSLSYPLDLQSRTDLGHYMMFYVNIPNESAYQTKSPMEKRDKDAETAGMAEYSEQNKAQNAILKNEKGYSKNTGQAGSYNTKGRSWKAGEQDKVIYRKPHEGLFPKMTKRTNDAITLYMPNTGITAQHTPQWAATEMGTNVGDASKSAMAIQNDTWGGLSKMSGTIAATLEDKIAETLGAAAGGADLKGIRDKMSNKAENKFLETFFKGIDMRKFEFNWQFRPKSPDEVFEVQKIIKTFKFHSLPEMPERNGRFFTVPATWDIFYMYRGDENQWINKIATCVCGSVNINYSPTTWQTFRPLVGEQGAPPTEIDMALNFMETRIITKQDVLEGF